MSSNATRGQGTLLQIGDGVIPTEGFTTIAEVKDIEGPGMEGESQDVTSHSSPEGWREKIIGLLNAGQVTFTMNALPADPTHDFATGLMKKFTGRVKTNFKIVFTDAANETWTFAAYVTNVNRKAPVEGVFEADVTLECTGKPTFV